LRILPAALVLALAACGGTTRSPADVVRAWSDAINANDNARAAALFARDAKVIQSGELVLHSRADARRWNAALPCAGHVDSLRASGGRVTATFTLGERARHTCDAPGRQAAAVFEIRGGKIVLWHQIAVPAEPGATVI
jgi:limonene-1,2-epoxide hydrolase